MKNGEAQESLKFINGANALADSNLQIEENLHQDFCHEKMTQSPKMSLLIGLAWVVSMTKY